MTVKFEPQTALKNRKREQNAKVDVLLAWKPGDTFRGGLIILGCLETPAGNGIHKSFPICMSGIFYKRHCVRKTLGGFTFLQFFEILSRRIEGLGLIDTALYLTRTGGPADDRAVEDQYRTTVSER